MKVKYTKEFEVECDIEQAEEDYREDLYWEPNMEPDKAIYDAIEANLIYARDEGDLPQDVIEQFATALRKRIGGVQMEMEGVR